MEFAKKRKITDDFVLEAPSPRYASLTEEDAGNLLRPLTEDQLIGILQSAVLRHPDVLESVRLHTDKDPAIRKLFIPDKATGKSKGYGFVIFKHADSALLALKEPSKKLDGRVTVAQFASVGIAGSFNSASDVSPRKIYVGGVPFEISSERLLSIFSAYGEIEEGPLGFDKSTGKPKGFAFFVYKTEDGARAALVEPLKNIDGHQVACKFSVDNKKARPGGPQPTPVDNSGVPPPQQGMHQGPPPPNPYMYVPGRNQPLPNGLATRYNPNFGGPYGQPPPGEFRVRFPPPSSIGMGNEGYSGGPHYASQHKQPPPKPRGLYQGMPPYY